MLDEGHQVTNHGYRHVLFGKKPFVYGKRDHFHGFDFCTAASYNIKTSTLINAIQEQINQQLAGESTKPFNVREMMETALQNSWIMMTDKEKEAFYKRYLLCMKLNVSPDGAVSITLG